MFLRDLICKKYLNGYDKCTKIGSRISDGFINHSAFFVFDMKRAIVELPLNSIDAYRVNSSIGKFGMGFYSIFIFIDGNRNNSITIDSYSSEEDNWNITFSTDEDNNIVYQFLPQSIRRVRGTTTRVVGQDKPYESLFDFLEILDYFVFIPDVEVYARYEKGKQILVNGEYIKKRMGKVYIDYDDGVYEVIDYATGISSEVLYNSLLVPGISTKNIKYEKLTISDDNITGIHQRNFKPGSNFSNNELEMEQVNNCYLYLLVGDVPVISRKIAINYPRDLIIQMPQGTPLPVSRDGLIFTDEVNAIFYLLVDRLFEQIIDKIIDKVDNGQIIDTFFRVIEEITNGNTSWKEEKIRDIRKRKIIFIPPLPEGLIEILKGIGYITIESTSLSAENIFFLERILLEEIPSRKDIFLNKSTIVTESIEDIYCKYFSLVVIINPKYLDRLNDLIIAYPQYNLIPFYPPEIDNFLRLTSGLQFTFNISNVNLSQIRLMLQELYFIDKNLLPSALTYYSVYYNDLTNYVGNITGYRSNKYQISMTKITQMVSRGISQKQKEKLYQFISLILINLFTILGTDYFIIPNICCYDIIPVDDICLSILDMSDDFYTYLVMINFYRKYGYYDKSRLLIDFWKYRIESPMTRRNIIISIVTNDEDITPILIDVYSKYTDTKVLTPFSIGNDRLVKEYLLSDLINFSFQRNFKEENLYDQRNIDSYTKEEKSQLIYIAANKEITFKEGILKLLLLPNLNFVDNNKSLKIFKDGENLVVNLYGKNKVKTTPLNVSIPFFYQEFNVFSIYPLIDFIIYYFDDFYFFDKIVREKGQVVDVNRKVYKNKDKLTGIKVSFLASEYLQLYLQESLYILLSVEPTNQSVTNYEGKRYNRKLIEIRTPLENVSIYRTYDNVDSWIKMAGVLICPITEVYKKIHLLTNPYKNILKGYIIEFSENIEFNSIRVHLSDIAYIICCHKYLDDQTDDRTLNEMISETNTSSDISQLSINDMPLHFIEYDGDVGKPYDYVGRYSPVIKNTGYESINEIIALETREREESSDDMLIKLQNLCIDKWYRNKREMKNFADDEIVDDQFYQSDIVEWLNQFITKFYQLVTDLNIPELNIGTPPTLSIVTSSSEWAAVYTVDNKIKIKRYEIEHILSLSGAHKDLISDPNNTLYGNIFPPSLLIHELFHSIEGTEHSGNHGQRVLTINGRKEEYQWSMAVQAIYVEVIKKGLYDLLD